MSGLSEKVGGVSESDETTTAEKRGKRSEREKEDGL